jgi:hypothetical protein
MIGIHEIGGNGDGAVDAPPEKRAFEADPPFAQAQLERKHHRRSTPVILRDLAEGLTHYRP